MAKTAWYGRGTRGESTGREDRRQSECFEMKFLLWRMVEGSCDGCGCDACPKFEEAERRLEMEIAHEADNFNSSPLLFGLSLLIRDSKGCHILGIKAVRRGLGPRCLLHIVGITLFLFLVLFHLYPKN